MDVLILGDGPEETAWAEWFAAHPPFRLAAAWPGFPGQEFDGLVVAQDLDEALAVPGIEVAVVGGPIEARGESLRRAAAEGLAIICLHPPGSDSEAYYQVSLSRAETGAIIVPDLPLRLHPGLGRLCQALASDELGAFRGVRHEAPADPAGHDLATVVFPRMVDATRAILGEIEAVTASGDPAGVEPDIELVVQLRAAESRRAEVRIGTGAAVPARLTVNGSAGSLTLEYDPTHDAPARMIRRTASATGETIEHLPPWDAHWAIAQTLLGTLKWQGEPSRSSRPDLSDGTRAMELSEAVVRSLRRGRTIDMHYESISEEATFKSIMTSTGCVLLLGCLLLLPLALAGPALGINGTIYIAYLIPPVLVAFTVLQVLRFGIGKEGRDTARGGNGADSRSR
jgi:myo-inositol 2-dehydrogenase/D-chiro-inositol 1-dehydrogenase